MTDSALKRAKREKGKHFRKPQWLKVNLPSGSTTQKVGEVKTSRELFTVCEEALCPNRGECWATGTATFMLMGGICTRGCAFCAVQSGKPNGWLDYDEPKKLADAVAQMKLSYVVLTSVTRDDLPDGGAQHLVDCIQAIKDRNSEILVEILIPDFQGKRSDIEKIANSNVDVIAHNIETVERLTTKVRDPRATYNQSLKVLSIIKEFNPDVYTKSSIMVGVGETRNDLLQAFQDLTRVNVDFLTIGQYLRPSRKHMEVSRYVHPDTFENLKLEALKIGFRGVFSGPLVRSSYKAGELFISNVIEVDRKNSKTKKENTFIQIL